MSKIKITLTLTKEVEAPMLLSWAQKNIEVFEKSIRETKSLEDCQPDFIMKDIFSRIIREIKSCGVKSVEEILEDDIDEFDMNFLHNGKIISFNRDLLQ